jgi:hypothetical protein
MGNYRDADINRALALFRAFDGGYIALPQEVLTARAVLGRVERAKVEATTAFATISPSRIQQGVIEAVLASAAHGELPDDWVEPILETNAEQVRLSHQQLILAQAAERAANALPTVVRQHADEIVVDGLRPALETMLAELRALRAKVNLGTVPFGNEAALARADKAVRDAHGKVGDLADRYGVLRAAQQTLAALVGRPEHDALATYGEMSNPFEVWPLRGAYNSGPAPWQSTPGGKVVWIALNPKAAIWMPTPDECEQVALERIAASGLRDRAGATGAYPGAITE